MNRIIALLSLLAICLTSYGQYDPEARKALDAMSNKYKSLDVFSANFAQNLSNKAANLDESVSGKITVKGQKYKLEINGQEVYNDGTDVYTYNPEINEVTIAPADEEEEITLSNVYDIYKDGYKYGIYNTTNDGTRLVDLEPEKRDKSFFKIRMEIASNNTLRSFSVFEPSGNVYLYTINDFVEKSGVADDFFIFNPEEYDDVEVVDFR